MYIKNLNFWLYLQCFNPIIKSNIQEKFPLSIQKDFKLNILAYMFFRIN